MNFLFQIQSLQLLISCMDDQEFIASLDYVLLSFLLLLHLILLSLTKSLLVPDAYVSIESTDCILLSSFEIRAILFVHH